MLTGDRPEVRARAVLEVAQAMILRAREIDVGDDPERIERRSRFLQAVADIERVADRCPRIWGAREQVLAEAIQILRLDPAAVSEAARRIGARLDEADEEALRLMVLQSASKRARAGCVAGPFGYHACERKFSWVAWTCGSSPRRAGPRKDLDLSGKSESEDDGESEDEGQRDPVAKRAG